MKKERLNRSRKWLALLLALSMLVLPIHAYGGEDGEGYGPIVDQSSDDVEQIDEPVVEPVVEPPYAESTDEEPSASESPIVDEGFEPSPVEKVTSQYAPKVLRGMATTETVAYCAAAVTIHFPNMVGVNLRYHVPGMGWVTLGSFDNSASFSPSGVPNVIEVRRGGSTYRIEGSLLTNALAEGSFSVPVVPIRVFGLNTPGMVDLAIVQSDWVYHMAPHAGGAQHLFHVFDNGQSYEVRMRSVGQSTMSVTVSTNNKVIHQGVEEVHAFFGSPFFGFHVPEGISNVWIAETDWAIRGAAEGSRIVLLNTGNQGRIRFTENGVIREETFIINGTNPFCQVGIHNMVPDRILIPGRCFHPTTWLYRCNTCDHEENRVHPPLGAHDWVRRDENPIRRWEDGRYVWIMVCANRPMTGCDAHVQFCYGCDVFFPDCICEPDVTPEVTFWLEPHERTLCNGHCDSRWQRIYVEGTAEGEITLNHPNDDPEFSIRLDHELWTPEGWVSGIVVMIRGGVTITEDRTVVVEVTREDITVELTIHLVACQPTPTELPCETCDEDPCDCGLPCETCDEYPCVCELPCETCDEYPCECELPCETCGECPCKCDDNDNNDNGNNDSGNNDNGNNDNGNNGNNDNSNNDNNSGNNNVNQRNREDRPKAPQTGDTASTSPLFSGLLLSLSAVLAGISLRRKNVK